MTENKKSIFIILITLCLLAIFSAACRQNAGSLENDNALTNEDEAIAARLTAVAVEEEAEQAAISESVVTTNPLAGPTTSETPQRLSVEIVRATPTAVPPTAVPPTAVPPTAVPPTAVPPTAVPPTAVPPTNTPVLLTTEPQAQEQQVLAQTTPTAQSSTLNPSNFDGRWSTNVGEIEFDQSGEQVAGTYRLYGDTVRYAISGSVRDRVLEGTYSGFDGGTFRFEIAPDGASFDGSWFYQGGGPANHWCGVRNGPLKPWCGYSGPWESIGDYVPDTPPITEIVQTDEQIRGTFLNGVYDEVGTLEGQVGREGAGSQLVAIGRWSIAGFSGDFRWQLLDLKSDQAVGYSITSDGVLHQWCNWRPGLSMPQECFVPE